MRSCNGILVLESLDQDENDLKFMDEGLPQLVEWRDNPPKDLKTLTRVEQFQIERAAKTIAQWESADAAWKEWRRLRTAPVHCLQCGSKVPHPPRSDWEPLRHSCGSMMTGSGYISSGVGPEVFPHIYDIDAGRLIERGRTPKITPEEVRYNTMKIFLTDRDETQGP